MRKIYVLFMSLMFAGTSYAEERTKIFEANLYGGIYLNNEAAWILEPSATWHFNPYLGLALGLEFTSQYNQPIRTTRINGNGAKLAEDEQNVSWLFFKPSFLIKSPVLWKDADDYMHLWVQVEPGLSLGYSRNSLTYVTVFDRGEGPPQFESATFRNKDMDWLYWTARMSVRLDIDRIVIGAGYGLSNLDYYSGRRNITLQDGSKFYVPDKELSQSIFLFIGFQF